MMKAFMSRARDANFHLGCLVKAYEDCVTIQGTPQEDVTARVDSAKRRDETRRACVALHDDMIAHIHMGTTGAIANEGGGGGGGEGGGGGSSSSKEDAARKANFFTECYNFTSSVERFKRALDRSAAKDAGRRETNAMETTRLHSAAAAETLTAAELGEAMRLCVEVDRITREKEAASRRVRDDVAALVVGLRSRAAEASRARDDAAEGDVADLVAGGPSIHPTTTIKAAALTRRLFYRPSQPIKSRRVFPSSVKPVTLRPRKRVCRVCVNSTAPTRWGRGGGVASDASRCASSCFSPRRRSCSARRGGRSLTPQQQVMSPRRLNSILFASPAPPMSDRTRTIRT